MLDASGLNEFVYTSSIVKELKSLGPSMSAAEVPSGRLFSMFGSVGVVESSLLQLWISTARKINRERVPKWRIEYFFGNLGKLSLIVKIRKMRAFILTLFCFGPFIVFGQSDDFHREIMDMMTLKGDEVTASVLYHDVFPKLQRNFASKQLDPEVWQALAGDESDHVRDYIEQGAFAYRQFLDRDEVATLSTFYVSAPGQKYVLDQELNGQEQKAVAQFFKSQAGKKLLQKSDSIALALDQIKKDWSEDLFKKKMRQLIKGGYLKN